MRSVNVWSGAESSALTVEVADDASLQQIVAQVAKKCGVPRTNVFVSVDGQRAHQLQQVPGAHQVVSAAVRTNEEQVAVHKPAQTVSIPPKPVVMHQDIEGFSVVVALDEVFDNSIRANATKITLELVQSGDRGVVGLVCRDDGAGMCRDMAINHMRLAHTDSGLVYAPRQPNMPLAASLYYSKELSRHGKGAAALLYFGDKVRTETKVQAAAEGVTVELNYKTWTQEFQREGTCTYEVLVTEWVNLLDEDESYTSITIGDLRDGIAVKLADRAQREQWAQQISDHYYFFIHGFPQKLWDTLPADLLQPSLQGVRPAGGLTIDLFGLLLSQQHALPPQMPRPRLAEILDTFLALSEELGMERGAPKLMPFWLPIRWCEPGMRPEQVPEHVTNDREDLQGGPAGKLRGVHRDFLMCLMYFPFEDGSRTKPQLLGESGVEDLVFTAWCGRMIPKAFSPVLPPIVAEAAQNPNREALKLTPNRLCAVLFCSPEVYTSNHKTELMDDAFDAVMKRLGSTGRQESGRDNLYVWDSSAHKWCLSAHSSGLLINHYKKHWASLESDGQIGDVEIVNGELRGKTFTLPGCGTVIKEGDLVQLHQVQPGGEAGSSQAGSSTQRRRSGGQSGGGRPSSALTGDNSKYPGNRFRLVEYFIQNQTHEDGQRNMVQLQEWAPSWVPGGGRRFQREQVALISPVSDAEAKKLQKSWESRAPKHLAWFESAGGGGGGSKKKYNIVRDIHQLRYSNISSNKTLSTSQVPPRLTVCFSTADNQLTEFATQHWWSSSIFLGNETTVSVQWQLLKATNTAGTRFQSVSGEPKLVKYTLGDKCVIKDLDQLVVEAGDYKLHVTTKCPWMCGEGGTLEYKFTVVGHHPTKLAASWGLSATHRGAVPTVRLGSELPLLEIRAEDAKGKEAVLSFNDSAEAAGAIELQLVGPADRELLCSIDDVEVVLSGDKQLMKVTGWRLEPQGLQLFGRPQVLDAHVKLTVGVPDSQKLQLPLHNAPRLLVLSGPPARLEARYHHNMCTRQAPHTADMLSRGSSLSKMALQLLLLDETRNTCLDLPDLCARVRFHPPGAAQDIPAANRSSSRRSNKAAAPPPPPPLGHPMRIEGNVVDLRPGDDFRWRAPPGAGPVGITVEVFEGKELPSTAETPPLLEHTGWYRMQAMHGVLYHSALDDIDEKRVSGQRWQMWQTMERPQWDPIAGFILNTGDFSATMQAQDKHVPRDQHAAVRDEVLDRFSEGYEPRLDVVDGQQVWSFVTPSGKLIRSPDGKPRLVKNKAPFFLADEWNSLLGQRLVYEVALMVDADVLAQQQQHQLSGLRLVLASEQDQADDEFYGRAKMCLLGPNDSLHPVFDDDSALDIAGGVLQVPPITLQPDWFSAATKGTATLILLDDEPFAAFGGGGGGSGDPAAPGPSTDQQEQQWQWDMQPQLELGRLHLRLAPAAEQLCAVAAGSLFKGVDVVLPGAGGGKGRAKQDGRRLQLRQQLTAAVSASARAAKEAAEKGAWAPWECVRYDVQGTVCTPSADIVKQHIDMRHAQLSGKLRLQLGQAVTLHFVATDFLGCPVVLRKEQREQMMATGLELQASVESVAPYAEVLGWKWARGSSGASAPAAPVEGGYHLVGPFVNSVTFKLTRGHGRGHLLLQLTGSFDRVTLLKLPVRMEAGPVAKDGMRLSQAQVRQYGAAATSTPSCSVRGYLDTSSWRLLQAPEEAAEVVVKQEPAGPGPADDAVPQQQQQQRPLRQRRQEVHQQQQEEEEGQGNADDPIDLTLTDDDDEDDDAATMDTDEQAQQQELSARQRWVAALDHRSTALLSELPAGEVLVEGSSISLQLQLYDGSCNEITSEKDGKLLLRRLLNGQRSGILQALSAQLDDQQQQPEQLSEPEWEVLDGPATLQNGSATFELQLGVGDSWCGQQIFQVLPEHLADDSEVGAALPVLLRVQVAQGPFPGDLLQYKDLLVAPQQAVAAGVDAAAAVSTTCTVSAVDALQALHGSSVEQQQEESLLQQLACILHKAEGCSLEELSACSALMLQLPASSQDADQAAAAAAPSVLLPEIASVVKSRDGSVLLPHSLQPLQVTLEYWLPPSDGAAAAGGEWHGVEGPWTVQAEQQEVPLVDDDDNEQQQQHEEEEEGQQQQAVEVQTVFELPVAARKLPTQAGMYRLKLEYSQQEPWGIGAIEEMIGPFVLLPAAPHRLTLAAPPQQQQQQQQPAKKGKQSGSKRGRGRGSSAAAAAGAGGGRGGAGAADDAAAAEAAAAFLDQVVLLDALGSTHTAQQVLHLRDCWGNSCRPAAAQLAAQLLAPVAAGADDNADAAGGGAGDGGAAAATEAAAADDDGFDEESEAFFRQNNIPPEHQAVFRKMGRRTQTAAAAAVAAAAAAAEPPSKRQRTGRDSHAAGGAAAGAAANGLAGGGGSSAAATGVGPAEWCLRLWLVSSTADSPQAQLVRQQPFDADGTSTVLPTTLTELGITSVGEWQLWGEAAQVLGGSSSSVGAGMFDTNSEQRLQVLLASWHVASESNHQLMKRKQAIKAQSSKLNDDVARANTAKQRLEKELNSWEGRLQAAHNALELDLRNLQQRQHNMDVGPHLMQLQQEVVQMAPQRRLLQVSAQRQLLEHPWVLQSQQQQQQQQRQTRQQQPQQQRVWRLMAPNEVPRLMPDPLPRLHNQNAAVLGPMVTLASVECRDVAAVLSAVLVRELMNPVCLDRVQQLDSAGRKYLNLGVPESFYAYSTPPRRMLGQNEAWYSSHPQQLLPPNDKMNSILQGLLDTSCYHPETGFIGFGSNLLVLNERQLGLHLDIHALLDNNNAWRLNSRAARVQLNLRQTLWNDKLGNVLVFERAENITALRDRARAHDKTLSGIRCIALDGYTYGTQRGYENVRLTFDMPACFGPAGPAAPADPLDLRLRYVKRRQDSLAEQQRYCAERQQEVQQLQAQVQELQQQLEEERRKAEAVEAHRQREEAKLQVELQEVQAELDLRSPTGGGTARKR